MKTAFAYTRVSTKGQADKDNSLPEQLVRIERYAAQNNIEILKTYTDADSAFHNENREQFNLMINDALEVKPELIISDDSSRFARTRQKAIEIKNLLRQNGINVRFANEPYVDPDTIAGFWLEGILEIKNEATSREIGYNVIRGMTHNLQNRDPETGWCFKNGGMAPYGYVTKHVQRGEDRSGRQILKAYWELDPEKAPIVREIIVTMLTEKQMSLNEIRDELNARKIPCRKVDHWSTGTISDFLSVFRLEQYAGLGVWNKEDPKKRNGRYKPREEWITQENAHPAIITKEELAAALAQKELNRQHAPSGATRRSDYLLSGKNFEGNSMFTCGKCGSNVIGYGNSSTKWKKYICGAKRTKGDIACTNDWRIDQRWLEQKIVSEIEQLYTTPEKVDEIIKNIATTVKGNNQDLEQTISNLKSQFTTCELEIKRLLDAIKSGIDPTLIADEVNALKKRKDELSKMIDKQKRSFANKTSIDIETIKEYLSNFGKAFVEADVKEKRQLLRTFVRHIEMVPETMELLVEFYPNNIVQSIGGRFRDT